MTAAPDPSPLLAAKLSPPRLRAPSVRADQLEQVAGARHVRLLLVQAPAGFGKTTLVAAAATALDWRSVWYRLDARDGAPRALLHSLAHAVRQQVPGFGEHLLKERSAPERTSLEESAAAFAREFQETVHEDLFLVLDGYEAPAERSSLDALFADLLTLLPPTLHLVILSRRRPSFALAKLALDGDFAEISHADLRFDADQVAAVVRWQSSIAPTSATIERLLHLTEGWPAGVVLASNVLRQADPGTAGDALAGREFERELFPYFLEEVYAPQSDELQTFLKASCYLEAMDAELAAAVNGSARAEGLLEQLAASGAFTFVDAADGTYRYHPLFRRFLEARQLREDGPEARSDLQRRTAAALAAHGFLAAAARLYLALAEPHPLLALLREHGRSLLDRCSDAQLERCAAILRQEPECSGWHALVDGFRLHRSGSPATAPRRLSAALEPLSGDRAGRYLALQELGRQCYVMGAYDEALASQREALELAAPAQEAECLAALAVTFSGACRWRELDETLAAFEAHDPDSPQLAATMAALRVSRAYGVGNLREALAAADQALPSVRCHLPRQTTVSFVNSIAVLNCLAGRYEKARELLAQAQAECDTYLLLKPIVELQLTHAMLLAQEGWLEESLAVFAEAELSPGAQADGVLLAELYVHRAAALRRARRLEEAGASYAQALRLDGLAPLDRLNVQIGLAAAKHSGGAGEDAARELESLGEEAAGLQLLFQEAQARFFGSLIATEHDGAQGSALARSCAELVYLGQLDLLGQELACHPAAAHGLFDAGLDSETLDVTLCALASQPRGPALLAASAACGERQGLIIVEAAQRCLGAERRAALLVALLARVEGRVRRSAVRLLAPGRSGERLFPQLTAREEEVLSLLALGCSNREIADRLSLEMATVKSHVHRILTTTGVRGRWAAALLYQQRAAATADGDEGITAQQ